MAHYSRYIATLVKLITKSNFPEIGMLLVSFGLSGSFKENQKYRKDASNATILWHSRIDLQSDYCDSKVRSIDVSETKDTTVARTFFLVSWVCLDGSPSTNGCTQ